MKFESIDFQGGDVNHLPKASLTYLCQYNDEDGNLVEAPVTARYTVEDEQIGSNIILSSEDFVPAELQPAIALAVKNHMVVNMVGAESKSVEWERTDSMTAMNHLMEAERLFREEAEGQKDAKYKQAALDDAEAVAKVIQVIENGENHETVVCSICHKDCNSQNSHLHQGERIGDECCWDERLRASE